MIPTVLGDVLTKDQNNLNLVRLFAALAVVYGHAFALHPTDGYSDLIGQIAQIEYSGSIAVCVFFFISGMLVTGSFVKSKSAIQFIVMRLGRILPGLFVCLVISALLIGPIITSVPVGEYLADDLTYRYIRKNMELSSMAWGLPGVFDSNHYKGTVNGSLWTLVLEIRCYAFVLIAGMLGMLSTRSRIVLVCLAVVLAFWLFPGQFSYFSSPSRQPYVMPAVFFLFGMLCYASRGRIIISWKIAAAILIAWLLVRDIESGKWLLYLFVAYGTLALAAAKSLRRFDLKDDCSYGAYLYGFVVQQTVAHYFPDLTSYQSLVLTIPVTLALGFASWRLVEKPSLRAARSLAAFLDGIKVQAYAAAKSLAGSR